HHARQRGQAQGRQRRPGWSTPERRTRSVSEPELVTTVSKSARALGVHKPFRFPGQTWPMRVLVVDDDPAVLDSLERALRIEGYAVDAVGAGFQALERALLRRTEADATGVLEYAHLRLDPTTREVTCGDRALELTRTEFALLELLARNPRVVLPRRVIFERVWGYDFGPDSNSLEVFVGYLRRKTEADGEPRLIQTVRGVGYVLREQ